MKWTNPEYAGLLPMFFSEFDPRPAREQADSAYAHGGGWRPFPGFQLENPGPGRAYLVYPGDPEVKEISRSQLRSETLILFHHSWLAIVQPNGDYEIARMD